MSDILSNQPLKSANGQYIAIFKNELNLGKLHMNLKINNIRPCNLNLERES
jgi:hypothetical protein